MTSFRYSPRRSRLARGVHPEDKGFVLIAVVLLLTVLLILALIAFGDSQVNRATSAQANANTQADATANAGLAAALYDLESSTGQFPCSNSGQPVLTSAVFPQSNGGPKTPTDSYSVTIDYYSSDWTIGSNPPGTSAPSYIACSAGGVATATPTAAWITSTGSSTLNPSKAKEVVSEQVHISAVPQGYVAFQAPPAPSCTGAESCPWSLGTSPTLSLAQLLVKQPSGGTTVSTQGIVYTQGQLSDGGNKACGGLPGMASKPPGDPYSHFYYATLVASGSLTLDNNCEVAGDVDLGPGATTPGSLTTSQGGVDGDVNVSGGNMVMSNSIVWGNVSAGDASGTYGNIELCPSTKPTTYPPGCTTSLSTGPSTIYGTATATGTVSLGSTAEPTSSQINNPPCPAITGSGDKIGNCIQVSAPYSTPAPTQIFLPVMATPASGNFAASAWKSGGYSTILSGDCSTGASGVAAEAAAATVPTIIVVPTGAPSCTSDTLTISSAISLKTSVAIFAPSITLGGGSNFTVATKGSSEQLFLIAEEPPGGSCNDNITVSNGNALSATGIDSVVYSPCTLSVTANATTTGEALAQNFSLGTSTLTMYYTPLAVPGLTFGYQAVVEERNISQL
jgi:type II secretory pathway pseudopilin PulG